MTELTSGVHEYSVFAALSAFTSSFIERGLQQVLHQHFPYLQPEQVLTVSDSPNDQSLFDYKLFPQSVGVANVLAYCALMENLPRYVTTKFEAEGFCELVDYLVNTYRTHLRSIRSCKPLDHQPDKTKIKLSRRIC